MPARPEESAAVELFLETLVRGLGTGSVYALLGLGFVIIYKSTQVVNFAQPSLMILGAYFASYFAVDRGVAFWLAVPLAMLVTAVVGAITERIAMRPMVGEPVFSAAMVTVGVFIVLTVVAGDLIGTQIRQVGDPWGLRTLTIGSLDLFQSDIARIVFATVVVVALLAFFRYSRYGLAMRATAFDQETALAVGVRVGRMFGLSWAISGGLAAVAGIFVGGGGGGVTTTTQLVALKALPAIILGGLDSIGGAVIGGLAVGLLEQFTKSYQPGAAPWLGQGFDQVVPYILMLLVLLVRPYGLFGTEEVERV
jgi:branched-chain amino acid transport system permease protein